MRTIALVASVFLLAPAAMAQEQPPAAPQAESPAPPKEKKTCRAENSTGTMMVTRICHTKAEWAAIDAQNQSVIDRRRNGSDRMSPN